MRLILFLILMALISGCAPKTPPVREERGSSVTAGVLPDEPSPPPQPAETVLGEASTALLDDGESRVANIDLACAAINGTTVPPGGSFSFNGTVGRRTEANGYGDAPVIVNGHKEQGCGGGVCQVSSTLYMAALNAGLQIDERHPHSHGVAYAPDGNDATVVFGQKDLAFTNTTDKEITLSMWTEEGAVFSKITQKDT